MDPLTKFQMASVQFDVAPTPDNAESLLVALESLSGMRSSGVLRRIEKAKIIYLADGRCGSEDNPI